MRSRTSSTSLLAIAALATSALLIPAAPAGAATAAKRKRCESRGSKIRQTKRLRVFSIGDSVYACRRPDGARRRLGTDDGIYELVSIDRIARNTITYSTSSTPACKAACPPDVNGSSHTYVLNVVNGRRRDITHPGATSCSIGRTVFEGPQVRVFNLAGPTYACPLPAGTPRKIGTADQQITGHATAGFWFLYTLRESGGVAFVVRLRAINAVTGQTRDASNAAVVAGSAITPNGAFAWVDDNPPASPAIRSVIVNDTAGERTVGVDASIQPASLAIANGTVTWTDNSGQHSAPFSDLPPS